MKEYETTFVIDSLIKPEEVDNIIAKVEKFISNNGGEVLNVDRWGKKRLAYAIKKRQYGYYVHLQYTAPNHLNKNLEREYKLDENILRHLIVLLTPDAKAELLAKKAAPVKEEPKSIAAPPAEEVKDEKAAVAETPVPEKEAEVVEEVVEEVTEAPVLESEAKTKTETTEVAASEDEETKES